MVLVVNMLGWLESYIHRIYMALANIYTCTYIHIQYTYGSGQLYDYVEVWILKGQIRCLTLYSWVPVACCTVRPILLA